MGEDGHEDAVAEYLETRHGLPAMYEAARELERIPVTLPDGFRRRMYQLTNAFGSWAISSPGRHRACTASVTQGGTMSDLAWNFEYAEGVLSDLGSSADLAGPVAVSGTLHASASINDGLSKTASVAISVQPRSDSILGAATYQVNPEEQPLQTAEPPLPLHPEEPEHLGHFRGVDEPDGDPASAMTLIDGGPNTGIQYFTGLPGLSIVGRIWINRPALEPGSDFMALQTDCTAEGLLAAVESHEGLPPVQQESHTKYFQDKFNEVFPGLLEPVAGVGDDWAASYTAARNAARQAAEAHSANLDAAGVNLGCNIKFF